MIVSIGKLVSLSSLTNTTGLITQGWVPDHRGQAGRESQGADQLLQWLLMEEGFLPTESKQNLHVLLSGVWQDFSLKLPDDHIPYIGS